MSPPWMPLYIADYRADTAHLSAAEHGAYFQLIMHYWTTGGLPGDDRQLARIACMSPTQWKAARPIIAAFFREGWKHKRIDAELKRVADVSASYAARARQAAVKRWSKDASSIPQALPEECLGMPSSQPHSQRKKEKKEKEDVAADAAPTPPEKYVFSEGIIRLTKRDFDQWKQAFNHLSLEAELISLAPWAEQQLKWFHAVSSALAKRNRQLGVEIEKSKARPASNGLEGII